MDLGVSEFRLPPQRQDRFEAQQQLLERLIRVTEQLFDETVDINMKGVFFTVQKAIPLMSKGSAIVLNASINAHLGMPGTTVYGATKAGVVNLAKTLSAELLERGIRVNAVSPGPITSALLRDGSQERIQETKDWIQNQVPIKRFGTPEEIAAGVLYCETSEFFCQELAAEIFRKRTSSS